MKKGQFVQAQTHTHSRRVSEKERWRESIFADFVDVIYGEGEEVKIGIKDFFCGRKRKRKTHNHQLNKRDI
jgi:hypothetical protein